MTDTFACLIAGSISSLHGNEIIKSSIQADLPFLSIPIPLYRLSEIHSKTHSLFFIHGKTNPIHPSSGRESPGTPSIEKLFQFFLGTFIIVILKSLSPDYHACLPAVFRYRRIKYLAPPLSGRRYSSTFLASTRSISDRGQEVSNTLWIYSISFSI